MRLLYGTLAGRQRSKVYVGGQKRSSQFVFAWSLL
jgi:hypothetical protein